MTVVPLRMRSAWKALEAHHVELKDFHLRRLFAEDAKRGERLAIEAVGIYFDYSKNRVTDATLKLLLQLAGDPLADSLGGAKWLTPFGVEIRYPGDTAEMLPGDEGKAIEIAEKVKQVVLAILATG